MKAVMYHYVRRERDELPYFTYLHADDFAAQLDYFQQHYRLPGKDEILEAIGTGRTIDNGLILTFDDGLSDHYEYVFPMLRERGLWGIFYLSTLPYASRRLLDVHRAHYLLGAVGGETVLDALRANLTAEDLIPESNQLFSNRTYQKQSNSAAVQEAKRLINYYIKPERRTTILGRVMQEFCPAEQVLADAYYLSRTQTKEMIGGGMSIACHSHSHTLLSNLNEADQEREILDSKNWVRELTEGMQLDSFCYPYGGSHSYNKATLSILKREGFQFCFSVESRNITQLDVQLRKHELPRFDCNEFPFGKATLGKK